MSYPKATLVLRDALALKPCCLPERAEPVGAHSQKAAARFQGAHLPGLCPRGVSHPRGVSRLRGRAPLTFLFIHCKYQLTPSSSRPHSSPVSWCNLSKEPSSFLSPGQGPGAQPGPLEPARPPCSPLLLLSSQRYPEMRPDLRFCFCSGCRKLQRMLFLPE